MVKKLLARYRAKRDFTKTEEPSGQTKVGTSQEITLCHSEARGFASPLRSKA